MILIILTFHHVSMFFPSAQKDHGRCFFGWSIKGPALRFPFGKKKHATSVDKPFQTHFKLTQPTNSILTQFTLIFHAY